MVVKTERPKSLPVSIHANEEETLATPLSSYPAFLLGRKPLKARNNITRCYYLQFSSNLFEPLRSPKVNTGEEKTHHFFFDGEIE